MIKLTPVKRLQLAQPLGANPYAHLSAASGLVKLDKWLFIVADDEKHLIIFNSVGTTPGIALRIMDGEFPLDTQARKDIKHDFEAIALLPHTDDFPHGALLILGSGSKKSREQGVIIPFLEKPGDSAPPQLGAALIIDLDPIYDALKDEAGKPNIEGALIIGKEIVLFQRGNKNNRNAIIRFKWRPFYAAVSGEKCDSLKYHITHYELGDIQGVPLCFTDATCLPDGSLVFTATAENTADACLDGACLGSAIGIISEGGELIKIIQVDKKVKLEGIEAEVWQDEIRLWLVCDPDNPEKPGQLFTASLHLW